MKASFVQLQRFHRFRREIVSPESRALSDEASAFLDALFHGLDERTTELPSGSIFWRAQEGIDRYEDERGSGWQAYRPDRMKPTPIFAKTNRASEKGVPMLYLASDMHTAMSELRPWFHADLSVAEFRTNRDLKIANCIKKTKGSPLFMRADDDPAYRTKAAWGFVADAFSRPVQAGHEREYRLTQHIASVLRERGYDGITYKSICTVEGTNVALFDLECADVISLHVYRTRSVQWDFHIAGPSESISE